MIDLVTIDPGLTATGIAGWSDGTLAALGVVWGSKRTGMTLADRIDEMGRRIAESAHLDDNPTVVIETTGNRGIYPGRKGGRRTGDSIAKPSMVIGAATVAIADRIPRDLIEFVAYEEWAGRRVSSDTLHQRIEWLLRNDAACGKGAFVKTSEHALDAVGIGLWYRKTARIRKAVGVST